MITKALTEAIRRAETWPEEAQEELAEIARLKLTMHRISMWPESAATVANRKGVHQTPLVRYPYKIFYRVTDSSFF
jgi:hypothetical protein